MTMRYKQTRNSVTFNTPQHKSSTFKTGFVRSSVTYEEKTNKTNELTQSLQVGLDTATEEDIRSIGTNIQAAINDINKDIKALNKQEETEISRIQSMESELERVISERDKGRELYTHHVKNRMETKVVLDSQRRLMDKYIFITEQLSSRPSTANRRPQTASTHRPGTAKDKDTRMNFFSSPNAFTRRPSK